MNELETKLVALGHEVDWPPAPPLTADVRRRLEEEGQRWRGRRWWLPARRILVPVLALLLLGAATAMAASSDVRDGVLRLLHIKGAEVERVRRLPPVPPREKTFGLGTRVTLAEARARAGFSPLVPASHEWTTYLDGDKVNFTRGRLLVGEFRGATRRTYLFKAVGPGTTVRQVTVRGTRGWWIAGRPHQLAYKTPSGAIDLETLRLADNTLLWNERELLVRVEGARSLRGALAIARSLSRTSRR